MAITLRADKGARLTFNELDVNFTSFFYSASVSSNQEFLNLHFTGSANVAPASSVQIPLNPYTGSNPPVAGSDTEIQYNNGGSFGAKPDLIFDSALTAVSIGQSTLQSGDRLATRGGDIRIESTNASYDPRLVLNYDDTGVDYSGSISLITDDAVMEFRNLSTFSSAIEDSGFKFFVNRNSTSNPALQIYGTSKITFRNATTDFGDVTVSGSLAIDGNAGNINRAFRIKSVDSSDTTIPFTTAMGNAGNARAVVLDGPHKGHVIVGLKSDVNSSAASQTFSILRAPLTSSNFDASYNSVVAMFKANGQVGIGTHTLAGSSSTKLHVQGDVTSSGFIQADGALKAGGNISGSQKLYVSGSSTLSGSVTLSTVGSAATADHYDYLVISQSQVVKQVNAAPIPKGGIIMWSGTGIPNGFALCDGNGGVQINGVTIPDLTDKFIVGAGSTYNTGSTGGSTTHDHGGSTGGTSLSVADIPAHSHVYKDSYHIEHITTNVGIGGAIGFVDYIGGTNDDKYRGSGDTDSDNNFLYGRLHTTNPTGSGQTHNHTIASATLLPPYYALAFIIYTG
tara:strand:+ start:5505 stop:7202 length:1698 start_codon:yes stop_codon:yes gene_type:complete